MLSKSHGIDSQCLPLQVKKNSLSPKNLVIECSPLVKIRYRPKSVAYLILTEPCCFTSPIRNVYHLKPHSVFVLSKGKSIFFSFLGFPFTGTWIHRISREEKETILHLFLPLVPVHRHSEIYLKLFMWNDYLKFLIISHAITRLMFNKICPLRELFINHILIINYWVLILV